MNIEHNCFRCNFINKIQLDIRSGGNMRPYSIPVGVKLIEPTFISKSQVEVEYNCSNCKNKNKFIEEL